MRVNLALGQVGLSQVGPGQRGPVIYQPCPILPTFFIRDASMRCVLYIKNVQQKFEGIMFSSIYIIGLSILFTTVREADKKHIFCKAYSYPGPSIYTGSKFLFSF